MSRLKDDEKGEFMVVRGRVIQVRPVTVQDAPDPPGRVLMEEEVFATWVATSLIIAVMGTQFTSRDGISDKIRIPLDLVTMLIAAFVLIWAALSYFNFLPIKYRSRILLLLIAAMIGLFVFVMVLVSLKRI